VNDRIETVALSRKLLAMLGDSETEQVAMA